MEFRVLGRVAVAVKGSVVDLGATREAALLADLLVHANTVVPTNQLVEELWRGAPPPGAVATLHAYIRNLRRLVEADDADGTPRRVLVTRRPGYVLSVGPDGLDAWRARRLIDEGRAALAAEDAAIARDRLGAALDLWAGPAFGPLGSEEHLRAAAAELDELRLAATEDRVDADMALGRHAEVCGELEHLVAEHPYRERFWAQLILALYRSGRQADALRNYQRVRRILADELGIDPGTRLRNLESAVLAQEPVLDPVGHVPGHRGRAIDVFSASRRPSAGTSFVGREADLAWALALLKPGAHTRLVTITGPGGVGKTRLALRAAVEAEPGFGGGAWFVSLATTASPEAVPDVVLSGLGGARQPGVSALDALADVTAERRLLVVLDNCEHVLDAAARCAEVIVGSGDSVLLATSRQPLGVPGEHVVPVSGLSVEAAVALFSDRARAGDPAFTTDAASATIVADICQRLDGLPLAIELAASRVPSMSLTEIGDRLAARFRFLRARDHATVERHQTLHAAVRWSVELLDPQLSAVFNRLSVFRGGFHSDAVVGVCVSDTVGDDFDAVDALDALLLRSMVIADRSQRTTRYSLLDTMREFGHEQLAAAGDLTKARERHAHHYLAVAEDAARTLSTVDSGAAIATLGREWDNLRAAFEWFAVAGDGDGALRLVIAGAAYAVQNMHFELHSWGERAITLDGARDDPLWSAAAGITAGLRNIAGDATGSTALADEAAEHECRAGGPRRFEVRAALWTSASTSGDWQRALDLAIECEQIAAACGNPLQVELAWYFRVLSQLPTGPEGVRDLATMIEDHVRATEARGNPLELGCTYSGQLAYALATDRSAVPALFEKIRRWGRLAGSRAMPATASLLMVTLARPDDPLETLTFAHRCLTDHYNASHWMGIRSALCGVVRALVLLGRHADAALLLGGMTRATSTTWDSNELIAEVSEQLNDALGDDYRCFLQHGMELDRDELVQRALCIIDGTLDSTADDRH